MSWPAQTLSTRNIKASAEQPTSRFPFSSVHTTRSPLSPIDSRRNSLPSQDFTSTTESTRLISSDFNSSVMKETSRQAGNRGVESRSNRNANQNHAPSGSTSPTSQPHGSSQHTGSNVPDSAMYIINSLNSFSFGPQTPCNMPASRSVDPLSPLQQENDSHSDEFLLSGSNDTPRPSVVAQHHGDSSPNIIRSHPAQVPPARPYRQPSPTPMSPGGRRRVVKDRDRQNASLSPSASSTSLSSQSGPLSRADSRTSHQTSSTSQTSAQEYSSNDDGLSSTLVDGSANELTSEDEYGGSEFEDEIYSDDDAAIEIGSAHFEGNSSTSHEWDRVLYSGGTAGSGHLTISSAARRGSLPSAINIPGDLQDPLSAGRLREDSLATLRRPSRSLDDEIPQMRRGVENHHGIYGVDDPRSRPGVPSPASVPQSDTDWQRLESRSSMSASYKGKEVVRGGPPSFQVDGRHIATPGPSGRGGLAQDFDAQWSNMKGGIIFMDSDEMADIVAPTMANPPERKFSLGNRLIAPFFGNRRPSAATVSTVHGDSFGRAVNKWDPDNRAWSFRKERADSGGVAPSSSLSPRPSIAGDRVDSVTSDVALIKPEKHNTPFYGMFLGQVELWRNELVGRFKVDRRQTTPSDSSKGPQQRLIITSIADPYIQSTEGQRGPPVTVHKHSKATAFSISRHYRWENRDQNDPGSSLAVSHPHRSRVLVSTSKKSSSMILLAPRRVQEAFTNTNTTRRLESHGLLDDKEQDRRKHKAKDREREARRGRRREESSNSNNARSSRPTGTRDDSGIGTDTMNSSLSDATLIAPPASAPAPLIHTYPPSHASTSSEASASRDSVLDGTSSQSSIASSRRRRRVVDPYNIDTDDDFESDDAVASRTPYTEVYSTMDSASFEQQAHLDESNDSLFSRFRRKARPNAVPGTVSRPPDKPYDPPWLTMASRIKQEKQQRVVDNLNTSFKDVGLLPSSRGDKMKQGGSSRQSKKVAGKTSAKSDIFKDAPPDVLYMLLPLWPGETDQRSREEFPFDKPVIPSKDRQYLVIFYKTFAASEGEDSKKNEKNESKKRSRGSQNSSHDSTLSQREREKAHILLTTFHITCRVAAYADLQGSGIRVPDDGLAVTGPLQDAFAMTAPVRGDDADSEWALGACHSREAGIEFYSETFLRMNLATRINEPEPGHLISETEEIPEEETELTPLGRAVMEMAWVGGMALASFG